MGSVTFVGAGPYDQEYLTLAGKRALEEADCVLYDHLLDASILSYTKGICIYVGKQGHHPSMKQAEINALLVEKALAYPHVVRLKGGDSFVFGRGGEEALALLEANIDFNFVPGVTSAVAVAEMAGIPVTHRGIATGFLVLSAHLQNHALQIPIAQVQDPKLTLLFLMGNSRLAQIINLLLEAGRDHTTPIAIISNGCSPKQQVITGTLSSILALTNQQPPVSPAIIVVGDVVNLSAKLHQAKPYSFYPKRILVYKINREPSKLARLLSQQGAIVTEQQTGEIRYQTKEDVIAKLASHPILVFTSKHAIHGFFHELHKLHKDTRILHGHSIVVIGDKTNEVIASYGIQADHVAQGSREDVLVTLSQNHYASEDILYLCGDQALPLQLHDKLIEFCVVYENKAILSQKAEVTYDMICFTCASSVERCPYDVSIQTCVSIGDTTTKALVKRGCTHIISASTSTYEAMVEAIKKEEISCIEVED